MVGQHLIGYNLLLLLYVYIKVVAELATIPLTVVSVIVWIKVNVLVP
jgi:hypothetical protein